MERLRPGTVLDLGDKIYAWYGSQCNLSEKQKAMEVAVAIKTNDRKMRATLSFPQDGNEAVAAEFWEALGGQPASIAPAVPDEAPPASMEDLMKYSLWHVTDESGSLQCTEMTERPLKREHLCDGDSYILETYDHVYIWLGQDSSRKEKAAGMKVAKDFVKQHNKPKGTKVSRLPQGTEDSTFKSYFDGFYPFLKEDFGAGKGVDTSTSADQ